MLNRTNGTHRNNNRKISGRTIGLCAVIGSIAVLFVVTLILIIQSFAERERGRERAGEILPQLNIREDFLTENPYSRPGTKMKRVKGIVVHYTANPGTDAVANRNYFNNLPVLNEKKKQKTYASSHFIIGIEGEIIQCIPLEEIAYASNDRNRDTISIECCHKKKNGKFTDETYRSLVSLTAYLCGKYNLSEKDVIRHYDVTGKNCPKYFVEHEDAWQIFLQAVALKLKS